MSPKQCFRDVPRVIIVIDHFRGRWTLPTCSNMPYTTCIPTIVCLVWPLEASRGPNEPKSVFSGCPQSDVIVIDHFWGRWTLPTCSNMPYTTFIPIIVCLVWPLEASRGPNEPKSVFSGCPQSDIIVIYHFWGRWTLPTCSNMPYTTFIPTIVCVVWPLEASKAPKRPK
jgi:hypothetical protein